MAESGIRQQPDPDRRSEQIPAERRLVLRRLAAAIGLAVGGLSIGHRRALAQDGDELPHLMPDNQTAKALMYVENAADADPAQRQAGAFCHNCRYFQGDEGQTEGWAGCQIFPQHSVAAKGWCISWMEKT